MRIKLFSCAFFAAILLLVLHRSLDASRAGPAAAARWAERESSATTHAKDTVSETQKPFSKAGYVPVWSPEKLKQREEYCGRAERANATARAPFDQATHLRNLPDFFLAGTQKGGTTAAGRNLFMHTDIYVPRHELRFFSTPSLLAQGREHYNRLLLRLPTYAGEPIVGEKGPLYMWTRDSPMEMKKFAPNSKLILLLREPFRRAYSAYVMALEFGVENRTFPVAIRQEMELIEAVRLDVNASARLGLGDRDRWNARSMAYYLRRGFYHVQILNILKHYDLCDVFIAISERVYAKRVVEYDAMLAFLGARGSMAGKDLRDYNVRAPAPATRNPRLPPDPKENVWRTPEMQALAQEVRERVFRVENEKLFKFLGQSIPEWSPEFD